MADLTKTISNSLYMFGASPSTKWGQFAWGTGKWGENSTPLTFQVTKLITNALAPTSTVSLLATWFRTHSNSFSVSDAFTKGKGRTWSESLSVTEFELTSQRLQDGSGFYYVFIPNTTDADDQSATSYSEGSAGSTSYTSGTVTATTWS